jgi:DNA-binding response OmpR family regulator
LSKLRKSERLDQVLLRLGYATQAQIQQAVKRQSAKGGRVGKNLVELGAITEDQLFDALVEQFRLPTTKLDESSVPKDLLDRMPPRTVVEHLILPMAWDADRRVLSLAVANPSDTQTIEEVRQAFKAETVRLWLAQDTVLGGLARRLMRVKEPGSEVRLVHLPELFGGEPAATPTSPVTPGAPDAERVLMIASGSTRKNFLPPIFEREGKRLVVATSAEEAVEALAEGPVSAVLLAADMQEVFANWRGEGRVPNPDAEVTVFTSVSGSLLENPVPYGSVAKSLRSAVQALAQFRAAQHRVRPPYGLMASDVTALARALEMRRVVIDALHLALHLLLPADLPAGADGARVNEPFREFASSSELATRLRFPWDLGLLLSTCRGLYDGRTKPDGKGYAEVLLAAQVLSLVWYRHTLVPVADSSDENAVVALRTALRDQAGRLATLETVEEYLQLITERDGLAGEPAERRVLLVGSERIARALVPAFERVACETSSVEDLTQAQAAVERQAPAATVVDHQVFGDEVAKFSRIAKLGGRSLLFVLTDSSDPALVLNLLDIGVDDVFGPPHDFDLIAARINRAIRSRPREQPESAAQPGQFSATFEHFSFLDLAQMLSQSFKTVRVDLSTSSGEKAVLFMQKGRFTHAICGDVSGPQAVYRVIAWGQDGEFTVREESVFPAATIQATTESLLMEGCRLLDEAARR